ncbi:hypothetical protein [Sporomusa acidovorans]|uniref:Uncharacterized protein n=1 Tax=Sporomusa acidovorans (strain ATCC 49682 / DSM 3132 / Mol) TaxID=1123286 RepID=A0ABZ3J8P1_SPOA4|nr:hypothetical protein [Sporomusa acidovorans]SDE03785.1 hypothetical protein SAMN04488499_10072 [Sporomusa acidovorans]
MTEAIYLEVKHKAEDKKEKRRVGGFRDIFSGNTAGEYGITQARAPALRTSLGSCHRF